MTKEQVEKAFVMTKYKYDKLITKLTQLEWRVDRLVDAIGKSKKVKGL
jgi:hypothetical protein